MLILKENFSEFGKDNNHQLDDNNFCFFTFIMKVVF